jgi:predicted O-linked N-acetylglucosamine transferase (SPINDLY family)
MLGGQALATGEAPIARNGFATFGCFGALSKTNDLLIATWARLLEAVPDSRLILKAREFTGDPLRVEAMRDRFRSRRIEPNRIDCLGRDEDLAAHLARYRNIDICLDTFPYAGVTTSHDAVWMGVPFITLAGRTPSSRMGVSIATNLGHPEWIATSPDDYVARAAALACDPLRIAALRQTLRERLQASPLADAETFVRKLEAAYRQAWRAWCAAPAREPREAHSGHLSR